MSDFHDGLFGFIIDQVLNLIHQLGSINMGWLGSAFSSMTFYSLVLALFGIGTILNIIIGDDDDD